jgi:sec-independent protein translocase protein TatC
VITFLAVRSGITTRADLAAKRPYVIVGAFVLGMLLTPPDVISQILLAVPIWMRFEAGLILCGIYIKDEEDDSAESADVKTTSSPSDSR